jgi:hypothetical protein
MKLIQFCSVFKNLWDLITSAANRKNLADYPNCGIINRYSWLPQLWYHQQVQLATPTVVSSTGTTDYPLVSSTGTAAYPNCGVINRYS